MNEQERQNDALIRRMIAELDVPRPNVNTMLAYFTDDAFYHNLPWKPMTGKTAIREFLASTPDDMLSRGWEIRHQVAVGDLVMNERIDRWNHNDKDADVPVVGIFELHDGKIARWIEYFDLRSYHAQIR